MAPTETFKLQNTHRSVEQSVWVDDRKWVLPAQSVDYFPKRIAAAFLTQRGKYVKKYDAPEGYTVDGRKSVWLANNTGNPFEPAKIERQFYKAGKEEIEQIPNPLRTPVLLRWKLHTGQTFTTSEEAAAISGYSDLSINYPPTGFELAPYERKPFAAEYADRAITRDAFHEQGRQRSIVNAREPSSFEPNETWSLDELLLYCVIVDEQGIMETLKDNNVVLKTEAEFRKSGSGAEEKIDVAKREVMRTLFFRLIDDAWTLPTRPEFSRRAHNAKLPGWEREKDEPAASAAA